MSKKILVVEDESAIRENVCAYLLREGYKVTSADDGQKALDLFDKENPDMLILDLMLPKLSGETVCQRVRQTSDVPIIMMTAKGSDEDKIAGFNYGADDYVVKPFNPNELVKRVSVIFRRIGGTSTESYILKFGNIEIDKMERAVKVKGKEIKLTNVEYKLLLTLASDPKRIFARTELVETVLGPDFSGYERTIDSHIKNLRSKLKDDSTNVQYIKTLYGLGYRFLPEQSA